MISYALKWFTYLVEYLKGCQEKVQATPHLADTVPALVLSSLLCHNKGVIRRISSEMFFFLSVYYHFFQPSKSRQQESAALARLNYLQL